jgi:Na+-transporting NADH:ubiquinone oxidoreductase subunit C
MSEKNSKAHVILFALILSVVCSLLITAAATGLKNLQQENIDLDKKLNLLRAAGLVDTGPKPGSDTINALYDERIEEVIVDRQGRIMETEDPGGMHLYFVHAQEARNDNDFDDISGYIVPINTRGLWGKIQGYLAFENDGQTVSGFSVFSHAETPGLGGEIERTWFQKNFKGKKILNSQGKFVSLGIAKGKAEDLPGDEQDNYVDGISGATLTGRYLSEGIKNTLMKYEGISVIFRQKQLKPEDGAQNMPRTHPMTETRKR